MAQIISPTAAKRRASTLRALRHGLDAREFLEITTPVLLKVGSQGPAPLQPFSVLGQCYDLRNSIELLLRTALSTTPRVYDIGPAIRFEDGSKGARSAVEFTLLEFFASDLNHESLVALVEQLLRESACELPSTTQHINVVEWLSATLGISFETANRSSLATAMAKLTGSSESDPLWVLIDRAISTHLEPTLQGLTFLVDYPIETICLAKRKAAAPHIAERFEVYLNGLEIGHGFMDCADADDVLARMVANGGRFVDHAFVDLLRSGDLPQSGGFGIGIERLLAASNGGRADVRDYLHAYQHTDQNHDCSV